MRLWPKFWALAPDDRRLVVSAAVLVVLIRAGLWVLPFPTLRRLLGEGRGVAPPRREPSPQISNVPDRIGWAVRAVAGSRPGMTCLVNALAAETLLRRHGYPCEFRIGVTSQARSGVIKAHAWIEYDGRVIVGEIDDLAAYAVLTASGDPSARRFA
jgi:hypothetical protein